MSIEAIMHTMLGLLIAALVGLLILPAYKRRTVRLTTDAIKRSMPLTEAEIRADKDRLRAEYVLALHELESKLEKANLAHARQRVDINRRDAAIVALEEDIERMRSSLEEHENAHRVLEQTIMDRLPRVEARLAEARRLVLQRDREIAQLAQTAERQGRALEEANQINTKGRDEILRLNAALATRAARGRDSYGDDRQDGEIALRTELEALRAKSREQASMIARLQGLLGRTGSRVGIGRTGEGLSAQSFLSESGNERLAAYNPDEEIARLRNELSEAEARLRSLQNSAESGHETAARLDQHIANLKSGNEDKETELRQLRAELSAYKDAERDDKGLREGKTAMRARIASLESQTKEQTETIQRLRAEIAAANERTARQAAHFTDELRRLGAGSYQTTASPRRGRNELPGRKPLSERISEPTSGDNSTGRTGSRAEEAGVSEFRVKHRATGFLRALGGGSGASTAGEAVAVGGDGASATGRNETPADNGNGAEGGAANSAATILPDDATQTAEVASEPAQKAPRRGGLLERIIRADNAD